ncbi:2-oxo acid dehydrogenase subunit E2 [Georgenia sp. 311]|uniref:dihydrolipoamide acetyltransferase family protein n=1 Tax=Georgenia sp. 311 TaxID=2585134 RepID=UPI001111B25A|nr:dihydrolipoamide acetyltransferase family protein [Georgenia sp. 311]TNC18262.1 2-oxo acid dehydrogenase subunit E2 [Georgenia sp. 311]
MPSYQQFKLPDVGEGLTEAEIAEWRVAVGDTVTVNQTIVEIETAKSLVELPAPWAGVVTELLAQEGQTVPVGTPIVVIDVDPGGAPSDDSAAPAAETSGDVLVGYGTKEAPAARRRRFAADGAATAVATAPAPAAPAPARPAADVARAAATGGNGRSSTSPAVLAKPPVRKLAKDLGVDLTAIAATGPGGIVTREDVLEHSRRSQAEELATYPGDDQPWLADGTVSANGRQTRVPVRSVRRRTAEAMVNSAFTAPHVTVFHTVDVTRTMRLVARLKEDRAFADVRVTPLLLAAKALVLAVRRHPQINASWDEATQEIVYKHYVNLGIAAATPRGLVVPNIKDAHRLDLHELATAIAGLTATAREGRATPQDMTDGTVTITNVGVFGIDTGTPIINPGEAAILAFGAIRKQPWVHKDKVKPRWVTQLALSFDHRLVDGELGARVLSDVARVLENPDMGLVWS